MIPETPLPSEPQSALAVCNSSIAASQSVTRDRYIIQLTFYYFPRCSLLALPVSYSGGNTLSVLTLPTEKGGIDPYAADRQLR